MPQRILLIALWSLSATLAYCLLAFGIGARWLQALGLPMLGLLVVAIARGMIGRCLLRRFLFIVTICISLSLSIFEGLTLAWVVTRQPPQLSSDDLHVMARKIHALVEEQSWDEVIRIASGAGPSMTAEILSDIAYAHSRLGNTEESCTCYEQLIRIDPSNVGAMYELARVDESAGKLTEAAREYEEILSVNDSLPDVYFAYGVLLEKLERRESAIKHLERAASLYAANNPRRQHAIRVLTDLRSEGRH